MSAVKFIMPHRVGFFLPTLDKSLSKLRRSASAGFIGRPGRGFRVRSSRTAGRRSTEDYNLYELLGVESHADQSAIREAYRSLQKRCHPDIAGPAGHDMSIILNQVYAFLSDPASRSLYDQVQEQAKLDEFRGYTGRPIYSTWMGSEKEDRAVFVDEIRCVGCLKCALLAGQTFGIESVYGRARVVAQWADPTQTIEAAIQACPVDCICIVKRSDLAALEFLMFKQPRGSVRVGAGNTAGIRVANVFADVNKFQRKFREMREKDDKPHTQSESRMAAIRTILSVSTWLRYWQPFGYPTDTKLSKILRAQLPAPGVSGRLPGTERLREAAASLRAGEDIRGGRRRDSFKNEPTSISSDEYWKPMHILAAPSTQSYGSTQSYNKQTKIEVPTSEYSPKKNDEHEVEREESSKTDDEYHRIRQIIPLALAGIAMAVTGFGAGDKAVGGLQEHIAGPIALEIINSFWLQVLLATSTWYLIGVVIATLLSLFRLPPRE